jgi:hypothetical protein
MMTGIPKIIVLEELESCSQRASRILRMIAKETQHRAEDKGKFRASYVNELRKINNDLAQIELSCFDSLTYGSLIDL